MPEKLLNKFIKSLKIAFFAGSIILISIVLIYFTIPKIMDVDYIRKHPEPFNRDIIAVGKVHIKEDNPSFFLLLDLKMEKLCKAMPVVYKGRMPEADSEVIVYGKVRRVDDTSDADILWREYFLEAKRINTRKDNYSGNISYSLRQSVHEFGVWLKKKNKNIFKLVRGLIPSDW